MLAEIHCHSRLSRPTVVSGPRIRTGPNNAHPCHASMAPSHFDPSLDIAYAVNQCARFSSDPKEHHGHAVRWIGRYLAGTKDKGLILNPKNESFQVYVDADFSGNWSKDTAEWDPDTARSRSGFIKRQQQSFLRTEPVRTSKLCRRCPSTRPMPGDRSAATVAPPPPLAPRPPSAPAAPSREPSSGLPVPTRRCFGGCGASLANSLGAT